MLGFDGFCSTSCLLTVWPAVCDSLAKQGLPPFPLPVRLGNVCVLPRGAHLLLSKSLPEKNLSKTANKLP